jgi:hypothetical protein
MLPVTFIFALNDSERMHGNGWRKLIYGYKRAIDRLKEIDQGRDIFRVTTIRYF